ncbi:MAG: polysaccharide biosynthesis/export family protein [Bacteroidales bacterium]|nr:polysaccharide biosynthesis/export family protein [Bacteroidales bacterium]
MQNSVFSFKSVSGIAITLFVLLFLASCATRRNVVLLQDIDTAKTLASSADYNTLITCDDKLSIIVSTGDVEVDAPYNAPMQTGSTSGMTSATVTPGYIVDKNGCIDFPTLGRIKVVGMTRDQLVDYIQSGLSTQLKNPTVTIQLINFRVTMLGAVNTPGSLRVNSERFTVLDAIGMAGDLSPKSRRNNILVVRDKGGEITYGRLDLRSSNIFYSEYYYLQQNDIVYVEPTKSGIHDSSTSGILTYGFGVISSLISLASIILVLVK